MKKQYPDYKAMRNKTTGSVGDYLFSKLAPAQKKIIEDYLTWLSGVHRVGKKAMIDYRLHTIHFSNVIEKPLNKLTTDDVIKFWSLVNQDTARTTQTKNMIKRVVKRFLKWHYSEDAKMLKLLPELKSKHIIVNEKKINKQNLITEKELELMLRTAQSLRDKATLILLYETACRPAEIRNAKWKDINWENKTLHVFANKTQKSREIPINESIIHLKRWKQEFCFPDIQEEDFIFPSPLNRDNPIDPSTLSYLIRSTAKKSGIKRPIYPYLFRHSRLSEIYKKGVQDQHHKIFAGHSKDSSMTGVYVSMDDEDMIADILTKVYHIDELPPEKRHKLEVEIEALKNVNKKIEPTFLMALQLIKELRKNKNLKFSDKFKEMLMKIEEVKQ